MTRIASRFALFGLALSVASFTPAVFAQDNGTPTSGDHTAAQAHPMPDPGQQASRFAKHLGLSDEQTAKLTTIFQNRQRQMATLRSDTSLTQQDRRAKMRSIQQDTDTQINSVLTPDQQKQYASMKQNMMNRRHAKHDAANASGDMDGHSDSDSH